jgi:hypothetical protein
MPFVAKQRHQLATGSRRNDQRPDKHDRNGHHDQYISPTHGHFCSFLQLGASAFGKQDSYAGRAVHIIVPFTTKD